MIPLCRFFQLKSLFEEGKPADDAEKEIKAWIVTVLDTKYENLKTFARSMITTLNT